MKPNHEIPVIDRACTMDLARFVRRCASAVGRIGLTRDISADEVATMRRPGAEMIALLTTRDRGALDVIVTRHPTARILDCLKPGGIAIIEVDCIPSIPGFVSSGSLRTTSGKIITVMRRRR